MGKYTQSIKKYAGICTSQVDPNQPKRIEWNNEDNAIGYVNTTYARSQFEKKNTPSHYTEKTTYDKNGKKVKKKIADKWEDKLNVPYTLAFHDFNMEVPSNGHVVSITFEARMRVGKNVDVLCPIADFRVDTVLQGKRYDNTDVKGKATGWNSGHYLDVPTKTKLSSKFETYSWTMTHDDIKKAGITSTVMNKNITGVDLIWQEPNKINGSYTDKKDTVTANVDIEWVRCTVEYDVTAYKVDIRNPVEEATRVGISNEQYKAMVQSVMGKESSPLLVEPNKWFELYVVCKNSSYAHGSGYRYIIIDLPWDCHVNGTTDDGIFYNDANGNKVWQVPTKAYADYKLKLQVMTSITAVSKLEARLYGSTNYTVTPVHQANYFFYGGNTSHQKKNIPVGDDDIDITSETGIVNFDDSCVDLLVHGSTEETVVTVDVDFSSDIELLDGRETFWTLTNVICDGTVGILSQTKNQVVLQVPQDREFVANLRCCFYPHCYNVTGFIVTAHTSIQPTRTYTKTFDLQTKTTHIEFTGKYRDVKIYNHRLYSEVESDATVIPIVADDIDANMYMTPCQINMNVWDDLDYIGCIPLEHLHFDPKSTYKDTLLNSTYKNKRYMGKKLATDEDISLNVRLHPQQVTTLQGLIEMDKPIPINANHRLFEGDSLNHRGWAEVYAVKTERTNPHWYKCDIDVKYLTHNLKTRFIIERGKTVDDYDIPSIMSEVFSSGDNLSDTSLDKFFIVDTDGTFMYNEDYTDEETHETTRIDDTQRNFFSLDNGEHIHIQTSNKLAHDSSVSFQWSATLLAEHRENKVSKIVKLIDTNGNSVFEYEYDSLKFIKDANGVIEEIQSDVIYRVGDGDAKHKEMTYRYVESDEDIEDDLSEEVTDGEETGLAHYGTTLHISIKENKLQVVDEGFNGREVYFEETLPSSNNDYYYVVEWQNKNDDGETDPVNVTLDFVVQETLLTTSFADKFGKLIISPFPVPNRKLLFTREAEEGTLYYYQFEEGKEFSYIVEPYYQYQNGTDLKGNAKGSDEDVSIFNLNYGYEVVYIQNGLVRLGFNRMDEMGHMYLGKYDPQSEKYITTHRFHLGKYVDLNLNAISDDKIEVQASDSVFTIYRGHPYIKINHNDEDIYIDTQFNKVWGERVGSDETLYPAYFDLLNNANLLPESIGGDKGIKTSDITIVEEEVDANNNTSISWNSLPPSNITPSTDTILVDTDLTFGLTGDSITNYSDEVYVGGVECSFGSYTFTEVPDLVPYYIDIVCNKQIVQSGETTRIDAKVTDWSYTPVAENTTVYFYEKYEPNLSLTADKSIIQSSETVDLQAKLKDEDGSLVENETVYFYIKED